MTLGRYFAFIGIGAFWVGGMMHSHYHSEISDCDGVVTQTAHSCHCHHSFERNGESENGRSEQPSESHECHICQVLAQVPQCPTVVNLPVRTNIAMEPALPASEDAVDEFFLAVRLRGPPMAV